MNSTTYKPNVIRGQHAVSWIYFVLVLDIISLAFGYSQWSLLHDVKNGEYVSEDAIYFNDLRQQSFAIVYLVVYIITAVYFIRWFRRAYNNLRILQPHLDFDEGWAAGAWFVPIISLYRPFQIMKEIYTETAKFFTRDGGLLPCSLSTHLLGWWWALWITNNILNQFSFRLGLNADGIDELITATSFDMAGSIVSIPLALLVTTIIREYNHAEHYLPERIEKPNVLVEE